MLNETQYKELLQFRNGDIPLEDIDQALVEFFIEQGYISKFQFVLPNGEISETVMCAIANLGKDALYEFEAYAEKEHNNRAREEADKKEQNAKDAIDRRKQFHHDIIVATVGSAIGGLIVLSVQKFLGFI